MEAMDGLWTIYRRSVRRTDRMPTKCRHMPTLCSKEKRKGVREMDSKLSQMYIIQNHSLLFFLDNFVLESLFRRSGSSLCNFSQCVCVLFFIQSAIISRGAFLILKNIFIASQSHFREQILHPIPLCYKKE